MRLNLILFSLLIIFALALVNSKHQYRNNYSQLDEENKPKLKAKSLMTRDPRMVERKKPGQPKARKKFQFSKR